MKRLLLEAMMVHPEGSTLLESSGKKGYLVERSAEGRILKVKIPATIIDERNENDRVYSGRVMQAAIERSKPAFESRELLSTVNEHPESPYVTPGEASHIVTGAWIEGKTFWNEWVILDTVNGNNLRALVEANASFGVSIRGLGSTDHVGNILEDYEYLGTDCVGQPSARIRPRAEMIESAGTSVLSATRISQEGTNMDIKKYISEQITLLKANRHNVLDSVSRAMTVEEALANSKAAPAALQEAAEAWTKAKEELFEKKSDTAASGSAEKVYTEDEVRSLIKRQMEVQATFRKVMADSAEANARLESRLDATTKVASGLQKKLVSLTKENAALKEASTKGGNKGAVANLLAQLKKAQSDYQEAINIAAWDRLKYRIAVAEAAKALKSRNHIREAYQVLVSLTGAAIKEGKIAVTDIITKQMQAEGKFKIKESAQPTAGTVRLVEARRDEKGQPIKEGGKKVIGEQHFANGTPAIKTGEHGIPNWL